MVQQKLTNQNWPFNNPILSIILSMCKREKFLCAWKWWTSRDIPKKSPKREKQVAFFYKTDFCNDFHSVILKSNSLQPKEPFGLQLHSDNGWSSIQGGWQNAIGVIHCCFPLFTHFFLSFDSARSKRDDHPTDHVDGSEILHLGCFWKPVNNWINYLSTINWCRISSINTMSYDSYVIYHHPIFSFWKRS